MNVTTVEVKNLKIDEVVWCYYLDKMTTERFIGKEPTDENVAEFSKGYAERMMQMIIDGRYDNESYVMPQEERNYDFQYNHIYNDLINKRDTGKTTYVLMKKSFMYDGSSDFITRFENWKTENSLDDVSVKFI
jgi:hypothetical protein